VTGLGGSCEIKSEEAAAHRIKFPCCTGKYTSSGEAPLDFSFAYMAG